MRKDWIIKKLNNNYILRVERKIYKCQIGKRGTKSPTKKNEGDFSTPTGKWKVKRIYYRDDKVLTPKLKKQFVFKTFKITKNCAWCDDNKSNFYNKYLDIEKLSNNDLSFEKLWRNDDVYDIILVLDHNFKPIIRNKGSAVFIHCSFHDFRDTAGCVALQKKDLIYLISKLKKNTSIIIGKNK